MGRGDVSVFVFLTFHWIFSNAGGVKKVKEKVHAQLKAVARATLLARMYRGMISAGYIHPMGLARNKTSVSQ